ncbi:MAG: PUR family DNA/RNA-binding protein [Bacteroidia bacterium]|jgi:hypothetical protein|nr:PUR family DNA/RNA-binding protein [Bacteroidia bacterium]
MDADYRHDNRDGVFSRAVRAGKRTYFFDVKLTRGEDKYITITESKRRFSNEQGKYFYEKHKIFLYREDFEKFMLGLEESVRFIETGELPENYDAEQNEIDFEDL